jgi:hypothetical protein
MMVCQRCREVTTTRYTCQGCGLKVCAQCLVIVGWIVAGETECLNLCWQCDQALMLALLSGLEAAGSVDIQNRVQRKARRRHYLRA